MRFTEGFLLIRGIVTIIGRFSGGLRSGYRHVARRLVWAPTHSFSLGKESQVV